VNLIYLPSRLEVVSLPDFYKLKLKLMRLEVEYHWLVERADHKRIIASSLQMCCDENGAVMVASTDLSFFSQLAAASFACLLLLRTIVISTDTLIMLTSTRARMISSDG
jgi:hypothetical protein